MPHLSAELIPAMVTPFKADGSVDFEKAEKLAVYLANNGCDGILVNGTTGESPTLSFEEKYELVKVVKAAVAGKNIQILAGVGSNDTRKTVEEAQKFASIGLDGLLVVVPYYNKPTQGGMIEHFSQVARSVDTEIVIYNIPSRCVVLMSAETMATLHQQCPNIVGVKQSHPDMDAVSDITAKLPRDTWRTWCGDDSLTLPMMSCGAYGTFSVLAHLTGSMLREMIQAFKKRDFDTALELHLKQLNLGKEIFFLPNPTVIKTCLSRLGHMGPTLRSPMIAPNADEMQRIEKILLEYKAIAPHAVI
ncbi:MAG: 4-hydroxy-tetrahydrodipicolinate synthase [Cyanobacteria bacterium]|nr:4-hydroxy-tetrahydrodipicolinate synthase [Cyanobacteriota bacterium]